MQKYIFTYRGKNVHVDIDNKKDGHKVYYEENGITKEYIIKGISLDAQAKSFRINYSDGVLDSIGNVIYRKSQSFDSLQGEYDFFYNITFNDNIGESMMKLMINGLLLKLFGLRCFHIGTGVFFQPITADFNIVEPNQGQSDGSITPVVVDGNIATIQYSMNGTDWNTVNPFVNLNQGSYTVYIKNGEGTIAAFPITLVGKDLI